jgi:hypothetical protein
VATTTPNYGWPVPTSTDLVKDGAVAIEALGDAIDATVFGLPSGALIKINSTTVTSSASVSISNVFSATYNNYLIAINLQQSSDAANELTFRLRTSSGDDSTAIYSFGYELRNIAAATTTSSGVNGTTAGALTTNYYQTVPVKFNAFLNGINSSQKTMTALITGGNSGSDQFGFAGTLIKSASTHTGITFYSGSGTLYTGTIKIYGLAN